MQKRLFKSLFLLTLLLLPAAPVFASGFAIIEQSVSGLGNAFSGGAAAAEDASTIFFNPAGMVLLEGQQITTAAHLIAPSAKFSARNATSLAGVSLGTNNGGDAGKTALVPNFYYANKLNDKLAVGFGIFAPFGLATEYDREWVGRYHAVESDVMTINLNPSIAYRATDKLSIGIGLSAQYIDVTLSSMVDSSGGVAPNPLSDIYVNNEANDWGYGFNIGLLYQFSDSTRSGFHYRSQIDHKVEGETTTSLGAALPGAVKALFPDQGVHGALSLPATASLSLHHQATDKLALMADLTWTEWSSFDKLVIEFEGAGLAGNSSSTTTENWKDSMRYSIGASYQTSESLLLRCGLAYDESPISDEYRTPRIPGTDRIWVAFGAGYRFSPRLQADFGYVHLFVDDSQINKSTANAEDFLRGNLEGEFENSVDILSAQLTYNF